MKNKIKSLWKMFLFGIVLISVFNSLGCNNFRIKEIKAELEKLESQKTISEKKLNEINGKILLFENDVKTFQSNIRKRSDWTLSYMKENAGTVACMASLGYSVGKDNLFSKDVNDLINAVSVVCAVVAIFSEDFRNNVVQVVNTIDESDKAIKTWLIQIEKINENLKIEYGFRDKEQEIYQSLNNEIKTLKNELTQLERS